MIPHGRPVVDTAEVIRRSGMPPASWRRNERASFQARVKPLNRYGTTQAADDAPEEEPPRYPVYDEAQVTAYHRGEPLPTLPAEPHPDDLLDAEEAAEILGIDAATVYQYGKDGILNGSRIDGRVTRWPRRVIEARRDQPDQRHRQQGARSLQPDPRRDPRAAEVAAWLDEAERGAREPVTAAEIRTRYEVTERTAQRILTRARERGSDQP